MRNNNPAQHIITATTNDARTWTGKITPPLQRQAC
jgi:hypothetical protein